MQCMQSLQSPKRRTQIFFFKKNADKRTSMLPFAIIVLLQRPILRCFESCIARFIWVAHGRVGAKNDELLMVMTVGLGWGGASAEDMIIGAVG
jgi:hypothetical protein